MGAYLGTFLTIRWKLKKENEMKNAAAAPNKAEQ
jgi:hypothetical protein